MPTLVISDLHLGNRANRDVLRRPAPLRRLLEVLDDIDRLVLLGDLIGLVSRNPRRSLEEAEPVLRAIGRQLRPGTEAVVVPGNHDAPLVRSWVRAQGPRLGTDAAVPPGASLALTRVVEWLGPANVTVRYPGLWLDARTYATHGHYLDRHLLPESPVGLPRGRLSRPVEDLARPWDYERGRIRSHHRRDAVPGRLLERLVGGVTNSLLVPHLPGLLLRARMAPVTAAAVDAQMRHASLPALRRVLRRLELEPEVVLFGHVHRRGPLPDDHLEEWAPQGGPRVLNSGSWLYEPLLLDRAGPPHPYWPGGAILIDGEGPRSVGLLDELGPDSFRPAAGTLL